MRAETENPVSRAPALAAVAVVAVVAACGDLTPAGSPAGSDGAPTTGEPLETGQPGAPITLGYRIDGNPVVGQPVGIEISLTITLDDRPITLTYRVPEAGSLAFPESQAASIEILPVAGIEPRPQQVTVIPQRDGRVFLTVAAVVETDTGSMQKSMAVPLQVERAPFEPAAESDEDP